MARRPPRTDLGTEFTAGIYLAAAEQRWTSLEVLYGNQLYTLAIYTTGVAVESLFRAYRARIDPSFDARHDLFELARAARFGRVVPERHRNEYAAALSAVAIRWSNNHRYRSDAAMRNWLRRLRLNRGIAGDFLKENARQSISAAGIILSIGVAKWKSL